LFEFERHCGTDSSIQIVSSLQAKESSESRQRDIYDSHRHRTFSLAYYMTGNEVEAEKILTQTFIRSFQIKAEPCGEDVDRALVGRLREQFPLDGEEPAAVVQPAAKGAPGCGNVRRTDLEEAIQTLPPTERLLFLLRDVEGYTSAAIAKLLEMPEPRVQRSLFSARIRLQQALAAAGAERRAAA
jgi:RNA polymerase sigma-70 factor (ECF subfamily)